MNNKKFDDNFGDTFDDNFDDDFDDDFDDTRLTDNTLPFMDLSMLQYRMALIPERFIPLHFIDQYHITKNALSQTELLLQVSEYHNLFEEVSIHDETDKHYIIQYAIENEIVPTFFAQFIDKTVNTQNMVKAYFDKTIVTRSFLILMGIQDFLFNIEYNDDEEDDIDRLFDGRIKNNPLVQLTKVWRQTGDLPEKENKRIFLKLIYSIHKPIVEWVYQQYDYVDDWLLTSGTITDTKFTDLFSNIKQKPTHLDIILKNIKNMHRMLYYNDTDDECNALHSFITDYNFTDHDAILTILKLDPHLINTCTIDKSTYELIQHKFEQEPEFIQQINDIVQNIIDHEQIEITLEKNRIRQQAIRNQLRNQLKFNTNKWLDEPSKSYNFVLPNQQESPNTDLNLAMKLFDQPSKSYNFALHQSPESPDNDMKLAMKLSEMYTCQMEKGITFNDADITDYTAEFNEIQFNTTKNKEKNILDGHYISEKKEKSTNVFANLKDEYDEVNNILDNINDFTI